ncbi:hypothetical protein GcM3_202013 [Golovinomyces cichoracearum]|uniref:Uncharacterized protein n=1 Tax=Golovinomyces cichoracearum TaxID=62708 RepID=A0A420HCZ8_9PEZI|nr:hypothetical protein GcM3_202013 [Golovinomyces cichoracearum]
MCPRFTADFQEIIVQTASFNEYLALNRDIKIRFVVSFLVFKCTGLNKATPVTPLDPRSPEAGFSGWPEL